MRHLLLAAAVLCVVSPVSPTLAAISAFWVPVASGNGTVGVQYPSAATNQDPTLLTMQTWDLRVNTDGNWARADLRATLPVGNFFYRVGQAISMPNPDTFPFNPRSEWFTYIRAISEDTKSNNLQIIGGFPPGANNPSNGNATSAVPGTLSVSWGDVMNDPPSPPDGYQIARLTFPLGMIPDILTVDQSTDFSKTSQVTPDSTTAIPEIPEPATLAFVTLVSLLARRSRSA